MAPGRKKAKVEVHTLSDSESEDEGYQPGTSSRFETISNFNLTQGQFVRTDSTIEVTESPRKSRVVYAPPPPLAAFPAGKSSAVPGSPDPVADATTWLGLLNLNPLEPWNSTDTEKAQQARKAGDVKADGGAGEGASGEGKKKRKRTSGDNPLHQFMEMMETFLDEMLRREGLGDCEAAPKCLRCGDSLSVGEGVAHGKRAVRCRDCRAGSLWCERCVVEDHRRMYLHRVEAWNGKFFDRITLKSLGLRVQLGHPEGEECKRKLAAFDDAFLIIDSDGCHPVGIDFCECKAADPVEQLLREGLFPATTVDPRTAATFRVLETFQMLSFTGSISAYEFLASIWRRTDNTWNVVQRKATRSEKMPGPDGKVPFFERQSEWMRIVHEWRIIRMFKRFARGYYADGIKNTGEGDCALDCPACPMPGVNMPKWENIPLARRWLYALFLAIDANFKLRRKDVSSDERDPGLIQGYAYIVAELAYKAFLEKHKKENEIEETTCSNYDAIKSQNIRGGPGVAASGLGAIMCARHDMRRPVAAGDLQKGERYRNMDYLLLKTLRGPLPRRLIISYDIGCQWEVNLPSRCNEYEFGVLMGDHGYELTVLVPKFHLPAHRGPCVITHSFNLQPGVGRTDGEAPERGWSSSNKLALSTKEMGPGNRRDTLDDNFGNKNWEKTVEMPDLLADRAAVAEPKRDQHTQAFREFAGGLTVEQREEISQMVKDFENDKSNPNPYLNENSVLCPKDIKEKLTQEDSDAVAAKVTGIVHSGMTLSSFMLHGLEIQEAQTRHEAQVKGMSAGAGMAERTKMIEHGIALQSRINAWVSVQVFFAPGAAAMRQINSEVSASEPDDSTSPWSVALLLPSDPGASVLYSHRAQRYEFQYRIAQAETALNDLRNALVYDAHMRISKQKHSSGTIQITRSVQILKDMSERVQQEVARYRSTRLRLESLWGLLKDMEEMEEHKNWSEVLEPLDDDHITGPTCLDDDRVGEGGKILSWIWTAPGTGRDARGVALAALRVEFCRARARAQRWQEECLLLAEEMRRTERTFTVDIAKWEKRAHDQAVTLATPIDPALPQKQKEEIYERRRITSGKVAYAWRQAAIRRSLQQKAADVYGKWGKRLQSVLKLIECDS